MTEDGLTQGEHSTTVLASQGTHEPSLRNLQKRWNPEVDFDITYYLSGPMAGYSEHNFPAFEDAARILRQTGLTILSPHEMPTPEGFAEMSEQDQWKVMVDLDIAAMKEVCKGIILMKGWPQSRGARAELTVAMELDWEVWYYHDYQLTNMNRRKNA